MLNASKAVLAASAYYSIGAALSIGAACAQPFSDPRSERSDAFAASAFTSLPRDPACYDNRLTSTGGPGPQNPHTLVVRWTGFSNFELAYKGKLILLDAYFDRGKLPRAGVLQHLHQHRNRA